MSILISYRLLIRVHTCSTLVVWLLPHTIIHRCEWSLRRPRPQTSRPRPATTISGQGQDQGLTSLFLSTCPNYLCFRCQIVFNMRLSSTFSSTDAFVTLSLVLYAMLVSSISYIICSVFFVVLLRIPKPTPNPWIFLKSVHYQNLGFFLRP